MNTAVGILAMAFGGGLLWLTLVCDWHWTLAVLGGPMVVYGTVFLLHGS